MPTIEENVQTIKDKIDVVCAQTGEKDIGEMLKTTVDIFADSFINARRIADALEKIAK